MKISKYNNFINEGNLLDHLKSRGLDTEKTHVLYDEESGNTYFFLYNLSGQMIGYQKYNPEGVKKEYGEEARYYTFLGKEYDKLDNANRSKISVYGLETYDVHKKYIFVVEGIWDVIKLHNMGEPAFANLGNSLSDQQRNWYNTLPQEIIVIRDKDDAGKNLVKIADHVYTAPGDYKDLGEMSQEEVNKFISNIKKELNLL
jgi:hypothetical protein